MTGVVLGERINNASQLIANRCHVLRFDLVLTEERQKQAVHVFSASVALTTDAITLVVVQSLFLHDIACVWRVTGITNNESLQRNGFILLFVFVTLNVGLQKIVHLQEQFFGDQRIVLALDQLSIEQVVGNVTTVERISENLSKSSAIHANSMLLQANRNLAV